MTHDLTDEQTANYILSNLKDDLAENRIILQTMFNEENGTYEITTNHSYSVKEINDNDVIISNPWNTGADIIVPIDDFCNLAQSISILEVTDTSEDDNQSVLETLLGN